MLYLKDNVSPDVLLKHGFKKKYDEDTGEVSMYYYNYQFGNRESYIKFILEPKKNGWREKLGFYHEFLMSPMQWEQIVNDDVLKILIELVKNDLVEVR